MEEEKDKPIMTELWDGIDKVRVSIQTKIKERSDRIRELQTREQQKKSELEELEKLKKEFSDLLIDPRYVKFQKFINILSSRLTNELKELSTTKSKDEMIIKISGVSKCLDLLDTFTNHDKTMKKFLDKLGMK